MTPFEDETAKIFTRACRAIGLDLPGDVNDHELERSFITAQFINDEKEPHQTRERASIVTPCLHGSDHAHQVRKNLGPVQEPDHQ